MTVIDTEFTLIQGATAFKHAPNCSKQLKCKGNFSSMVQVEAKMFGVSSTLTLTQPGSKADVATKETFV